MEQECQDKMTLNKHKLNANQHRQQDTIKQQTFSHPHSFVEHQQQSRSFFTDFPPKHLENNSLTTKQQPYVPYQGVIPIQVRNRRFKKLLELRSSGFFDEQSIKLRHPLIYYLFVGQYQFEDLYQSQNNAPNDTQTPQQYSNNLLSSFLSTHLINIEYKHLLSEEMSNQVEQILEIQKNTNEEQIKQIKRILSDKKINQKIKDTHIEQETQMMEIELTKAEKLKQQSDKLKNKNPSQHQINYLKSKQQNRDQSENYSLSDPEGVTSMYQKVSIQSKLTEQEKQIQEQHLIEYCEELFLEGKLKQSQYVNYEVIDNNVEYDDLKQENKDLEEKYFDQIEEEMDQNGHDYYTGIQDY